MADLRQLLESAISQHISAALDTAGITAFVFTGTDNETKAAPCVIVACAEGEEEIPKSGIYRVTAACICKSAASGDDGDHDALCAAVRAAWKVDDATLATALETYETTLKVFGTGEDDRVTSEQDGDCWVLSFLRDVVCCET